jgi:hypothetical protein
LRSESARGPELPPMLEGLSGPGSRPDENRPGRRAVRALEPERQTHQLLATRLRLAEVEALERNYTGGKEFLVRLFVFCNRTRSRKREFAGILQSPLTDSNRRPPPYHGLDAASGRNPRQRFSPI